MDASISESDDDSNSERYVDPWQILHTEPEWAIALDQMRFRHPRVLLAYFRFICVHNEIAKEEEHIVLSSIPDIVVDFILGHISFQNTPPEFKNDVEELRTYVIGYSQATQYSQGIC
jgi:hypothetical protein